jgi:predicted nucleic acid-binding protein
VFACGLTMVVPDLFYDRELADFKGAYLRSLGLGVVSLSPDEVLLAQQLQQARPALSYNDCLALSCATRARHTLVTGDKALRSEAQA